MTRTADLWGPFTPGLDPGERTARARVLAALARVYGGPGADALVKALRRLERDPGAADEALDLLNKLPTRPRRHALSSYAVIHRPP